MSDRPNNGHGREGSDRSATGMSSPQTLPGRSEPRSIRRNRSTAGTSTVSSSLSQKTPARSFVHHASVSGTDGAQYASHGVRQQTAEIANWAMGPPSPSTSQQSHPDQRDNDSRPSHEAEYNAESSAEQTRPAVIDEISEPVTPEEHSNATNIAQVSTSHHSDLANMLRHSARRPSRHTQGSIKPRKTGRRSSIVFGDADENTPLIQKDSKDTRTWPAINGDPDADLEHQQRHIRKANTLQSLAHEAGRKSASFASTLTNPKAWSAKAIWQQGIKEPLSLLPCVFLGVLLNVLDALSYGMILFPLGEPIFANSGPDGISMFYVSCIVSQLVFSCGGSVFKGGVGSEMIEVVPFFHKMTYTIIASTGTNQPNVVLATVITSYALSSILTGIVFALLGAFRTASLVNFFPRHILIACIGGVGFFLFVTGIEVSARLDGNLEYTLDTAKHLIRADTLPLWTIPLLLALLLLFIKHFKQSPYIVPAFFISIAAMFYIVVTATKSLDLSDMRNRGYVFAPVKAGVPFYHFYNYYDFAAVDWAALAKTIPAMFALTFFGVLHVPINVPALAIAAEQDDLNLNRELVAHGISNALSGCCGSIQNYLVYVNSEMFISNGGNSRLAGLMLAAATFGVLVAGPGMIGFVPVMVVGALIYYLGIELLIEALWETFGKMNKLEYLTVLVIVLTMGIYDFVAGILVGIVLACLNFVVQTSRKSAIRTTYSGEIVESTVRRHPVQRHYLHEVGYQIHVHKLAGMLFFGSIVEVEKQSRALIEDEAFRAEPIRYLIFDFAGVPAIDYSAAEAFTRMERVLGRRGVRMVISGVKRCDEVGKGLNSVGLWSDDSSVEFFENLNLALESCENKLLKTFYNHRDAVAGAQEVYTDGDASSQAQSQLLDIPKPESQTFNNNSSGSGANSATNPNTTNGPNFDPTTALAGISLSASPRQTLLQRAATSTLSTHPQHITNPSSPSFAITNNNNHNRHNSTNSPFALPPPLPLLLHTFQNLSPEPPTFWSKAVPYFTRRTYSAGTELFRKNDQATEFLLLESGMLRATYVLPVGTYHERIVAGTTCGELPFFSGTPRTATVRVEAGSGAGYSGDGGGGGDRSTTTNPQTRAPTNEEGESQEEDSEGAVVWELTRTAYERMRTEWPPGAEELLRVALRLTKERVDAVTSYVLTMAG